MNAKGLEGHDCQISLTKELALAGLIWYITVFSCRMEHGEKGD